MKEGRGENVVLLWGNTGGGNLFEVENFYQSNMGIVYDRAVTRQSGKKRVK